jgi:hypothetical protein
MTSNMADDFMRHIPVGAVCPADAPVSGGHHLPAARRCKRVSCRRVGPEPGMNSPRLVGQHGSNDGDGLDGSFEKLATRNQEVRTSQHCELLTRQTVHDRADTRPVHLPDAHGARFTTSVEDSPLNLVARQLSDRRGYEIGFSVRGRVMVGDDRVRRGKHDLAVKGQKGSEWVVAVATGLRSEGDRLPDKRLMSVYRYHDSFEANMRGSGATAIAFQPQRLMIPPSAVGCKRLSAGAARLDCLQPE